MRPTGNADIWAPAKDPVLHEIPFCLKAKRLELFIVISSLPQKRKQLISSSSNITSRPRIVSGVTVERDRHSNVIYITKTYLKCCENMGLQSSQIDRRDI